MNYNRIIKIFLRLAIALGFLSAVADRFGLANPEHTAWGNWSSFERYVGVINPWFPKSAVPALAVIATAAEILFAICLLIGFKTELFAKLSGLLLLIFALSMTFSTGIKSAFNASVFAASAGAFALGTLKEKFLEIDGLMKSRGTHAPSTTTS